MTEDLSAQSFAGSLSGEVRWELTDDCLPLQPVRTLVSMQGELTPLGHTSAAGRHCADDKGGGRCGHLVFTAADGDTLLAAYTFTLVTQTPDTLTMSMVGQFVDGGTGRFIHADGSWTARVVAHMTVVPPTVDTVWPVDFTFEGRLICPAAGESEGTGARSVSTQLA